MLLLFIIQLSLLPFPFDLRTSLNFHGRTAITNSSRNIHGTFTDFRTYDNYGHFTEHSRIYGRTAIRDFSQNFHGRTAITEISRNIHGFTNVTELFENNHGNWS